MKAFTYELISTTHVQAGIEIFNVLLVTEIIRFFMYIIKILISNSLTVKFKFSTREFFSKYKFYHTSSPSRILIIV